MDPSIVVFIPLPYTKNYILICTGAARTHILSQCISLNKNVAFGILLAFPINLSGQSPLLTVKVYSHKLHQSLGLRAHLLLLSSHGNVYVDMPI